jgi:hypothetical protein
MTIDKSIQHLLEWATEKIDAQQEPPWARPHYEQLQATLVAIQSGREATISLEDSRQLALHLDADHPRAENIYPLEIARLRRGIAEIPLPM